MKAAFRAIRSNRKFVKVPEVRARVLHDMQTIVEPHFEKEFDKRVENWKHKPQFRGKSQVTDDATAVEIFPTGENAKYWQWNVEGTPPHIIRARKAPVLAFSQFYQPKTSRRPYYYGGSGKSSGPVIFAQEVHHPGTEPRPHIEAIRRENKEWNSKTMKEIWARAIRSA